MKTYAKQWPNRVWAIEGCQGIGRHIATRLLAGGERVLDVPPKLSARARVFATGQGRKTDATDAHLVKREHDRALPACARRGVDEHCGADGRIALEDDRERSRGRSREAS